MLEHLALTDNLSDEMARKEIAQVEVWENERLDPIAASKPTSAAALTTPGVWGSKHLRAGERAPWVKVYGEGSRWKGVGQGVAHFDGSTSAANPEGDIKHASKSKHPSEKQGEVLDGEKGAGGEVLLALQDQWCFLPGEDWRVDKCGLWSETGTDEGESYLARYSPFEGGVESTLISRWMGIYKRFMAGELASLNTFPQSRPTEADDSPRTHQFIL